MSDVMITVVGNIASDVDAHSNTDGTERVTFRLARNARRYDKAAGSWIDGPAQFYVVTCWRALASNVKACLGKGAPVVVQGRLDINERRFTTPDGPQTRLYVDITADHVAVDLARAVVKYDWAKSRAVQRAEERALADVEAVIAANTQAATA